MTFVFNTKIPQITEELFIKTPPEKISHCELIIKGTLWMSFGYVWDIHILLVQKNHSFEKNIYKYCPQKCSESCAKLVKWQFTS